MRNLSEENVPVLPPLRKSSATRRLGRAAALGRAAVFLCCLPLQSGASEAAAKQGSDLCEKLSGLIAGDPAKANNAILAFARRICESQGVGKPSLAKQLTNQELLLLAAGAGKVIPATYPLKRSNANAMLLSGVERALAGKPFDGSQEMVGMLLEEEGILRLLSILRDSGNASKHLAFLALAKRIRSASVAAASGGTETDGIRPGGVQTIIKHIVQDKKRCVSTCGLMALERLVGADFVFAMLPPIGDLYHDQTGRGTKGASPSKLLPLLGLDTESHDYADGVDFKSPRERLEFTKGLLRNQISRALNEGKFVVFLLDGKAIDHAVLVTGVHGDDEFVIHDPAAGKAGVIGVDWLADRWFSMERGTLAASIISFPGPMPTPKRELADAATLTLDAEIETAGLSELGLKKGEINLTALELSSRTFRWVDMTATTKDERTLGSMGGLPLVIKMQILAGRPVKTVSKKGETRLVTGYSGGFLNPEGSFQVRSKAGTHVIPWKELLKEISAVDSKGRETVFFGYLRTSVGASKAGN